jgi:hypothetical protein
VTETENQKMRVKLKLAIETFFIVLFLASHVSSASNLNSESPLEHGRDGGVEGLESATNNNNNNNNNNNQAQASMAMPLLVESVGVGSSKKIKELSYSASSSSNGNNVNNHIQNQNKKEEEVEVEKTESSQKSESLHQRDDLKLKAAVNLANKEFIKGFIAGQVILSILLFFLVKVFLLRSGQETRIEMGKLIKSQQKGGGYLNLNWLASKVTFLYTERLNPLSILILRGE